MTLQVRSWKGQFDLDTPFCYSLLENKIKNRGKNMDLKSLKLGFIGGGAMAENILRGILSSELIAADRITVSDIQPERIRFLEDNFKVQTTLDNGRVVTDSNVIILCVKPQNMKKMLDEISAVSDDTKLFLSIAAGVKSETISTGLKDKGRIIRIMPNIAAKVLQSASALCTGHSATEEDLHIAEKIFNAIGNTVVIEEKLMDAVTGLSGSGPAYFFVIIEAMADAGVKAGLSRKTAQQLAAQTCYGAAKLVLETGSSPATLKDMVTSPAGTTIAGIHVMEKAAVRGSMMAAVEAAVKRSEELG